MAIATFLSNPVVQRGLSAAAQALTGVPAAAPAPTQAETQRQRAFQAALARPDMPIPPEFSTGSALGDEQERLRARYALMRDAGRSAVAERARAQGRSVTYDQAGNPVIGDVNPAQAIGQYAVRPSGLMQSQVVDLPQGGRAVYDREGRLVGTSVTVNTGLDATDRAAFNRGQGTVAEQGRLRSAMEEGVRKAMQAPVAAAAATAPVAATAAAPVVAAPAAAAPAARPLAPTFTGVLPNDTPGAASVAARQAGLLGRATGAMPVTPADVDAALEEAQMMQETQAISQAERSATQATQTFENQIAELTRRLTAATRAGNRAETTRLTNAIRRLRSERAGQLSSTPIIEAGSPMF